MSKCRMTPRYRTFSSERLRLTAAAFPPAPAPAPAPAPTPAPATAKAAPWAGLKEGEAEDAWGGSEEPAPASLPLALLAEGADGEALAVGFAWFDGRDDDATDGAFSLSAAALDGGGTGVLLALLLLPPFLLLLPARSLSLSLSLSLFLSLLPRSASLRGAGWRLVSLLGASAAGLAVLPLAAAAAAAAAEEAAEEDEGVLLDCEAAMLPPALGALGFERKKFICPQSLRGGDTRARQTLWLRNAERLAAGSRSVCLSNRWVLRSQLRVVPRTRAQGQGDGRQARCSRRDPSLLAKLSETRVLDDRTASLPIGYYVCTLGTRGEEILGPWSQKETETVANYSIMLFGKKSVIRAWSLATR